MRILAAGGGSGGHVTPVAAVIEALHDVEPELTVHFVCDTAFEAQARGLMEKVPVPVDVSTISAGKFRRYAHLTLWQHIFNWQVISGNAADSVKIIAGFFQSLSLIIRFKPDVVFVKGGYVCLPLGIAAWVLRRPLVIHDSDTRPGLTNRVLSRFATRIATGSPLENYPYDRAKSTYVGVPINSDFHPVIKQEQQRYKARLGVAEDKSLIVATGGGLGAVSINDAVIELARELGDDYIIYNITGKKNSERAHEKAKGVKNYIAVPFVFEKMNEVLGAADLVIARGSATFTQELAGLKKPIIMVPAKQLGDQQKNAKVYEEAAAALVLSDDELAAGKLKMTVKDLFAHPDAMAALATSLHAFARPDAAKDTAQLIIEATTRH